MEKYANVKSMENLIEMGDDVVIDFVNNILDMIKNREIRIDEVKSRYGFNITDAKLYLASKYATKNGRFIKKPKTCRKRKTKIMIEQPALTDEEILALKEMVSNKIDVPERDQKDSKFVLGDKDTTICLHVIKEFQDEFKAYCQKNKQYNQSEHMMLAVLEYMKKYQ